MRCSKCNGDFPPEEMDAHNMVCSYAFSSKDYEHLIPCEICNELIDFNEYQNHINSCRLSAQPGRSFTFSPYSSELNNIVGNINNDQVARTLFNMFVGDLPGQAAEANDSAGPAPIPTLPTLPTIPVPPLPALNNPAIPVAPSLPSEEEIPGNLGAGSGLGLGSNLFSLNSIFPALNNAQQSENINIEELQNTLTNIFEQTLNNIDQDVPIDNFNLNYEQLSNLEDHVVGISDINNVSKIITDEIVCPICSCEKKNVRETKCKHLFCEDCLKEWLSESKKCPICMIDLE